MIYAITNAINKIKILQKDVYIITPTELGFKQAQKGKGINYSYIEPIYKLSQEKKLDLNFLCIINGGNRIKKMIDFNGAKDITDEVL